MYGVSAARLQACSQVRSDTALQIVTLIVWCAGRFFLYTSYYSIFGALFGFTNFGRMVAIDNTINGLVGLLQLPLTNWGLHGLGGNFTAINIIQVSFLWCCSAPLHGSAMQRTWYRRALSGEEALRRRPLQPGVELLLSMWACMVICKQGPSMLPGSKTLCCVAPHLRSSSAEAGILALP